MAITRAASRVTIGTGEFNFRKLGIPQFLILGVKKTSHSSISDFRREESLPFDNEDVIWIISGLTNVTWFCRWRP